MEICNIKLPPELALVNSHICVNIPPGPHKPLPYIHALVVTLPNGPWESRSARDDLPQLEIESALSALSTPPSPPPQKKRYYFLFDAEKQGFLLGTQDNPVTSRLVRETVYATLGISMEVHALGLDYLHGNGLPASKAMSLALFKHAAQQLHPKTAFDYAKLFWDGDECLLTTEEEALLYTCVAAESVKDGSEALAYLTKRLSAELHIHAPPQDIIRYYLNRVEKGEAQARLGLGIALLDESPAKGFPLIGWAADRGLPDAQWECYNLLSQGIFPRHPPNPLRAMHYLKLAADSGLAEAQFTLGQQLLGEKSPDGKKAARKYFAKAAAADHQGAIHELRHMDSSHTLLFDMR